LDAQQWQTPATDSFRSRGGDRKDEMGLDQQARATQWPTPSASVMNDGEDASSWEARKAWLMATHQNGNGAKHILSGDWMLTDAAETFPAGLPAPATQTGGAESSQPNPDSFRPTKKLNPRFVAWLMGFPLDWLDVGEDTLSAASATPSSRRLPK
jgi:DNA (cytosine-5)-methyltransferase 1